MEEESTVRVTFICVSASIVAQRYVHLRSGCWVREVAGVMTMGRMFTQTELHVSERQTNMNCKSFGKHYFFICYPGLFGKLISPAVGVKVSMLCRFRF